MRIAVTAVATLVVAAAGCGRGAAPEVVPSSGYPADASSAPISTAPADRVAVSLRLQGHMVTDVRCGEVGVNASTICSAAVDGAQQTYRVTSESIMPVR